MAARMCEGCFVGVWCGVVCRRRGGGGGEDVLGRLVFEGWRGEDGMGWVQGVYLRYI